MARRQSIDPELAHWAEHLPASFMECRDMGHSWKPYTVAYSAKTRGYIRTLRCQRCKTDRHQWLTSSGHVEATSYDYPDDYARPKGMGSYDTATRDMVRLLDTTRLLEKVQRASA